MSPRIPSEIERTGLGASDIIANLDMLSEIQAAVDLTRLDYDAKRAAVLATVQAELDALDTEYQPMFTAAQERIEALSATIKAGVIEHGASVKGNHYHAVFARGRVTWETDKIAGYAAAHPELLAFRREGAPSVSIRAIK